MKTKTITGVEALPLFTDEEYRLGLPTDNPTIVASFLYKHCFVIFNDINNRLFGGNADIAEMANQFYLKIRAENWANIKTFEGRNGCSLKTWITTVAWRFFKTEEMQRLFNGVPSCDLTAVNEVKTSVSRDPAPAIDINMVKVRMPNKRYVRVLELLLEQGYKYEEVAVMLGTTVKNVYNLKFKAVTQFINIYCDRG